MSIERFGVARLCTFLARAASAHLFSEAFISTGRG